MSAYAMLVNDALLRQLQQLRIQQGFTLLQVAKRAGIDRSYLGLLEKGKRHPTILVSARIAHVLGYRLSEVLAMAEEPACQSCTQADSLPLSLEDSEFTLALGKEIVRVRRGARISQEELALSAGLDRKDLSLIERGKIRPTLVMVRRTCQALGIQASVMVSRVEARL